MPHCVKVDVSQWVCLTVIVCVNVSQCVCVYVSDAVCVCACVLKAERGSGMCVLASEKRKV